MSIPADFHFSQNNLQDYVDCARRFELRHLLRQEWPALQSEPVLEFEHRAELGRRFHEMVHQSILGIPAEQIASQAAEPGAGHLVGGIFRLVPAGGTASHPAGGIYPGSALFRLPAGRQDRSAGYRTRQTCCHRGLENLRQASGAVNTWPTGCRPGSILSCWSRPAAPERWAESPA